MTNVDGIHIRQLCFFLYQLYSTQPDGHIIIFIPGRFEWPVNVIENKSGSVLGLSGGSAQATGPDFVDIFAVALSGRSATGIRRERVRYQRGSGRPFCPYSVDRGIF